MKFQSNTAFSKLAPDFVADAYGPASVLTVTANSGTTVSLLPAASAGNTYEIFSISIRATTSVASTGNLTVCDTSGNNVIVGFYEAATPQMKEWSGRLPYASQLNLRNSMTVAGVATIWFRTVPLPI